MMKILTLIAVLFHISILADFYCIYRVSNWFLNHIPTIGMSVTLDFEIADFISTPARYVRKLLLK